MKEQEAVCIREGKTVSSKGGIQRIGEENGL
jgi:hypothetical protein